MQTPLKPFGNLPPLLNRLQPDPLVLDGQARADLAACRDALREGSYTFFAASLLLPRSVREPASALYAFCRLADDAVDGESEGQAGKYSAVARLRDRLDAAYSGHAQPVAADRALAVVLAHFNIPRALPEALLEGFEWDAAGRRYETIEDLYDYAARVAATVGAMMAMLMGVRSADGIARACDLGVAMQLSNIARDVGDDARMGRIYLPLQWLREAGVDPDAWLEKPVFNSAIRSTVERLLTAADDLYARVDAGIAQLPMSCRPGINAARWLYAEIGHQVVRQGMDSTTRRAVVSPPRKAWVLARAVAQTGFLTAGKAAPALPATRFIVDATERASLAAYGVVSPKNQPWWRLNRRAESRAVWVLNLFERLEREEHANRAVSQPVKTLVAGN